MNVTINLELKAAMIRFHFSDRELAFRNLSIVFSLNLILDSFGTFLDLQFLPLLREENKTKFQQAFTYDKTKLQGR